MTATSPVKPLQGCLVLSLRPVGGHASLRRAAASQGARVLALSPWRLQVRTDAATRAALRIALAATRVVFASPAAVRAAAGLQGFPTDRVTRWLAVGAGTAAALRKAGIEVVVSPERMDSEGLLALPDLQQVTDTAIGLVTAPGGRDLIAGTLSDRGARVLRVDVYERIPTPPSARAIAALRDLAAPAWLALSSSGALDALLAGLPVDAQARLRTVRVAAASQRLAALARARGFSSVQTARSAQPRDLVATMAAAHPLA